nr:hypothetical protein [uncultured Dyadobacter sp.]
MKTTQKLLFLIILMAGWLSGCKNDDPNLVSFNGGGTEVGVPDGELAVKTIGPDGGTISSSDDRVQLVIPAGALAKPTQISIQPITNHAPNGLGLAYRFLPEGTTFAKPASLTFSYDPHRVSANDAEAFRVATQGEDRKWYRTPDVLVDTILHTITTAMPHFSDWTAYELAIIENIGLAGGPKGAEYVELGGSVELELHISNVLTVIHLEHEGAGDLQVQEISWQVLGGAVNGSVKSDGPKEEQFFDDVYKATFTAPTKKPASNPVTVVAEITLKGRKTKLQVVRQILVGKDYFRGTFGGTPFDWENMTFMWEGSGVHIGGWNDKPSQSLNIFVNRIRADKPNGLYSYHEQFQSGAWAEFSRSYGGEPGWISSNVDCAKNAMRVSGGGVTITQISIVNGVEYIQGHFNGTFYMLPGPCPAGLQALPAAGEFRIKNSFGIGRKPARLANFKQH